MICHYHFYHFDYLNHLKKNLFLLCTFTINGYSPLATPPPPPLLNFQMLIGYDENHLDALYTLWISITK